MKMEQAECSETSAYKIQTPGNHPKESIQQNQNTYYVQFPPPPHRKTCHLRDQVEKVVESVSSTLSLTPTLDGGGWSTPLPDCFNLAKEARCTLYRSVTGPPGQSGRVRKISPLLVFDPRTVHPVASRYTD